MTYTTHSIYNYSDVRSGTYTSGMESFVRRKTYNRLLYVWLFCFVFVGGLCVCMLLFVAVFLLFTNF